MRLNFTPQQGFYGTIFLNIFFVFITFGFYLPWAVTNIRRMVWSNISLEQKRFHYLGTATEIIKGYLVLALLYLVYHFVGNASAKIFDHVVLQLMVAIPFMGMFFGILYKAQLGSFKYQANRTVYSGVRFRTDLSSLREQYLLCFKWGIYTALTLGFGYSYFYYRVDLLKYNSLRYGKEEFSFELGFKKYFSIWLKYGLLILLVTFISLPLCIWLFKSMEMIKMILGGFAVLASLFALSYFCLRAFYEFFLMKVHTLKSQNLTFKSDLDFYTYYCWNLVSLPLLLITFGFALPIVMARNIALYANSVDVTGLDQVIVDEEGSNPKASLDDYLSHSYDLDILDVF